MLLKPKNFTPGQRMPASVAMTYKDGVYAIDSAGKDDGGKNILTWMVCYPPRYYTQLAHIVRISGHTS
jgi:hypothetical protein